MKKDIRNLSRPIRILICVVATILYLIIEAGCTHKLDEIEKNYDISQMKKLQGIITKIEECDRSGVTDQAFHTYWKETVELEDGLKVEIDTVNGREDQVGDTVTVYNQGDHYAYSQRKIATEQSGGWIYFAAECVLSLLILVIWWLCFGWKGIIICGFILLFALGISEADTRG